MKTLFKTALICTIASVGLTSTAFANSNLIDGNSTQAILEIAKGFGSATLEKDSSGDPKISGRINGTTYGIYFYACENHKNCEYMKFVAGYETDGKTKLSDINKWNNEYSLGRALLDDENDVRVDYPVMLYKGISKATVEESFQYWKAIMSSAEKSLVY